MNESGQRSVPLPAPVGEPVDVSQLEPGSEHFASWGQRLGAAFIDGLFILLLATAAGLVVPLLVYLGDQPISDAAWGGALMLGFAAELFFGAYYEVRMYGGERQATYGMRAMGIYLTDERGDRISRAKALGRWATKLMYAIPSIGNICLLASAVTIGVSQRRQALHDMIVSTQAVKGKIVPLGQATQQVGVPLTPRQDTRSPLS